MDTLLLLLLERITDTTPSNLLANIDIIEHKLCLSDNFLKAYQMVHSMPMMGLTLLQYSLILERRFPYYFFIKNFHLLHFVAFFHVASLFSTGVDNEKVGVHYEKKNTKNIRH